ncbi:MAG: DUF2828 family protein [Clostridia bacterium]|nr:DUF2828 family protein [Clostridia bacterium]
MNKFVAGLQETNNFGYTENGAVKRTSTGTKLLDMFALGGAYRSRSDEDVILLFKNAYEENPVYALKCLFYLRDVRGGQGERRFFRVCLKWAADHYTAAMQRNLEYVSEFGRYDDLYSFVGTKLESAAFAMMKTQLELDVDCKTPSLLAKWLKSENTSSRESRMLGNMTRKYLGMTHKQYRKTLSILRERINVLERLMSENRWDEIEFDKIPSKAGLKYRNAFARRDIIKAKYEAFAKDENTKVNAKTLYPYECVAEALKVMGVGYGYYYGSPKLCSDTNRLMVNKYWDNLADYFNNATFNGMAVVDTSGSMVREDAAAPINVAVSLGMYCAEKAQGPFHNKFMTFSSNPTFVEIEGIDFCDKVSRMLKADWGGSTNIEAAFDLMLNTAIRNRCTQDEIPENLIVISDMEFDSCVTSGYRSSDRWGGYGNRFSNASRETLFESMKRKWAKYGYQMPKLTFWNVDARSNNIPMKDDGTVSYVSGMSPVLYEQIMKGLTAYDLMMDKLNNERYSCIK